MKHAIFQMSSTYYNHLFKTFIVGEHISEVLKLKPKEELSQNLCQMTTLKIKKTEAMGPKGWAKIMNQTLVDKVTTHYRPLFINKCLKIISDHPPPPLSMFQSRLHNICWMDSSIC